jgi:hypothetical protein
MNDLVYRSAREWRNARSCISRDWSARKGQTGWPEGVFFPPDSIVPGRNRVASKKGFAV